MRWFWIDRFTEFRAGKSAKAVKTVSISAEHVDGYMPGFPIMAQSLVIEGLAQMGGLLVSQLSDFRARVVLAKISRATFRGFAEAGMTLAYQVELQNVQDEGALVRGTVYLEDELHAEVDLCFAYLGDNDPVPPELFDPLGLARMLRVFRTFEVGVDEHGARLQMPAHLIEAEQGALVADTADSR